MDDWLFCPRCSAKGDVIRIEPTNPYFLCHKCGFSKYNNPLPSTIGLIEDDGKLLLLRRAVPPCEGQWDAVGGFLAPHESAEECLIREALEEIGCEVTIRRCLGTFSSIYGESGLNTIGVAYICTLSEKGKIQLSLTENSSYSWFSYDSLPDIAFLDVRNAISSWVNENNSD